MKNIRKALKVAWIIWMWACTFTISMLVLAFILVHFVIWEWSGFSPHFLDIDSCLDSGGRWNEETKACEYA